MVINKLDGIEFRLNVLCDFSWLKKYGTAFFAIDETGSGCICIGMQDDNIKYFCKIAGVNTIDAVVSPQESVRILKEAVHLYYDLKHPNLVKIIDDYSYESYYVVIFEWTNGECLFDHWNFEKYSENLLLKSPKEKFKSLSTEKRLESVDVLFSFLKIVTGNGYVAVDFYDGSIMYDFDTNITTICDIDFFRKKPTVNDMGEDWFGTKRLKAPEEYLLGAVIDETTNVFTLGALLFEFFGYFSKEEIAKRYAENRFIPCQINNWQLNNQSYFVALKAVNPNKSERFQSISQFFLAWDNSLCAK